MSLILEVFGYISALGGGSVITILITKITTLKRDKQDLITNQSIYLTDVNTKLNNVVEQLQEVACYVKPCNARINGLPKQQNSNKSKPNKRRTKKTNE